MLKVLVTGVNGFVGQHLVRELHGRGYKVMGTGRDESATETISGLMDAYYSCDLTDISQVDRLPLENLNAVINLAGLANVGASFDDPGTYHKVNVGVLEILGNRLLKTGSSARVIAISTGAVYKPDQPQPLTEKSDTITVGSPYALSKLEMEQACQVLRKRGMDTVIVRPFNHSGPGQLEGFVVPDLYEKVIHSVSSKKPLKVGNMTTKRDYTDVRDIVKAYADLASAETLHFDIYNVCSGRSHAGQEILDQLLQELGISQKIEVIADESLIRPSDPGELFGSHERITEETGWEPDIPFEQTISDFVSQKGLGASL